MTRWKRLITADPTDADFVYAVWDRVQAAAPDDPATPFSGDTLFARSTDGGETWEPAQTILDVPDNSNIQSLGNQIVVLGDGMFVNVFNLIAEGTPIVASSARPTRARRGRSRSPSTCCSAARSPRRAASSTRPTGIPRADRRSPPRRGGRPATGLQHPLRRLAGPALLAARAHRERPDRRRLLPRRRPHLDRPRRASANRGVQSFTGPVHVNSNGTVGVTYYDFTNDDPSGGPLDTDAWFTASPIGGLTFTPRERLTGAPFGMRAAPVAPGFFVGDYEGLTEAGGPFVPAFVLANAGEPANATDVVSTTVMPAVDQLVAGAGSARRARVASVRQKLDRAVRLP